MCYEHETLTLMSQYIFASNLLVPEGGAFFNVCIGMMLPEQFVHGVWSVAIERCPHAFGSVLLLKVLLSQKMGFLSPKNESEITFICTLWIKSLWVPIFNTFKIYSIMYWV